MTEDKISEREEIEMLLPWFVTRRLDAADTAKVEAYLVRDPAMRRQLDLIVEEQGETILANEAVKLPRGVSVARSMERLTAKSPTLQIKQAGVGLIERLRDFFVAPTATGVRYAAIAAALVIALQAATLGTLWSRDVGPTLASGKDQIVTTGTFALVKFKDDAGAARIAEALAQLDMNIVDGPRAGLFTVRLAAKVLPDGERDAKLAALRQRGDVVVVATPRK